MLWCPQKITDFIAKNAVTREKKSLHLRRQMWVLHSEWLQCSSNLSGLAQLGPIFGNMISPLHIAHSGEKSPIFEACLNVNIVSESGSLRAHTFWLDYSPTTVPAIHVSCCLLLISQGENKTQLLMRQLKIRSLHFTLSLLYLGFFIARSNSLFKGFLFIQVLSS